MCCPSQLKDSGARRQFTYAVALVLTVILAVAITAQSALAQGSFVPPAPRPSPSPTPTPNAINADISSSNQVLNLGSNYLERLGNQATNGLTHDLNNNPGGGGASEVTEGPRYRSWGEVYGLSVTEDPQGVFYGD